VHRQRLRELQGLHTGRRAFIIGNGPSINRMDLTPLKAEITFAVNSTFRLYEKLGFQATYTCVTDRIRWFELKDDLLEASSRSRIFYCDDAEYPTPIDLFSHDELERITLLDQRLRTPRWLAWLACVRNRAGRFTYHLMRSRSFARDITRGVCLGNSVIFTAAQIAAYMGCNPIILIGVDMDYSGPQKHFHDRKVWTPPMSYERDAKPWFVRFDRAMAALDIRFLNASLGGKVDALKRVPFDDLFNQPLNPTP